MKSPSGWNGEVQAVAPRDVVAKYAFDAGLDGPFTYYTTPLLKIARPWPPEKLEFLAADAGPVYIRCFKDPDRPDAIGFLQTTLIYAPLEKLFALFRDRESLPEFFREADRVELLKQDGNRTVTRWTEKGQLWFLPGVQSERSDVLDVQQLPGYIRWVSRLNHPGSLREYDSLIIADALNQVTRFARFEFRRGATWWQRRFVGASKLWEKTLRDAYQTGVIIRMRAERPDMTVSDVLKEATAKAAAFDVAKCRAEAKVFDPKDFGVK
jgi:hypothetical protein